MILTNLSFNVDKFYEEEVKIDFSKKMCLIGDNATGKTTLLKAVNKIFNGGYGYSSDYFRLDNVIIEYRIKPKDEIRNILHNSDRKLLVIETKDKNGRSEFNCPWIINEFEYYYGCFTDLNKKIQLYYIKLQKDFSEYCLKKNIDIKRYLLKFKYNERVLDDNNKDIDTHKRTQAKEVLKWLRHNSELGELYLQNELVVKYGNEGRFNDRNYLSKLFSDCIIYGDVKNDVNIDFFNKSYKEPKEAINNLINEYNELVWNYNRLFTRYSEMNKYLNKEKTQNVIMVTTGNPRNMQSEIFDLALRVTGPIVYQSIYEEYKKYYSVRISDEQFLLSLQKLRIIKERGDQESSEQYQGKLIKHKKKNLKKLKHELSCRNIIDDYWNEHSPLCFFDSMKIIELVEETLISNFPQYLQLDMQNFEVSASSDSSNVFGQRKVTVHPVISGKKISFESLSTGTVWAIRFGLIKALVKKNDVLLIDEPALFLHQKIQREVLDEIIDLECNVIYTTHTYSLLPVDNDNVKIITLRKNEMLTTMKLIDTTLEEDVIDIFGLKNLQNTFISTSKKVVLIGEHIDDFHTKCENSKIRIDVSELKGKLNIKVVKRLNDIMSRYDITPVVIVSDDVQAEKLKGISNSIKVFTMKHMLNLSQKDNVDDLSTLLERE